MASNYHYWKKEAEELDRGGHICLQPKLCYGDVRLHVLVYSSLISHTFISAYKDSTVGSRNHNLKTGKIYLPL